MATAAQAFVRCGASRDELAPPTGNVWQPADIHQSRDAQSLGIAIPFRVKFSCRLCSHSSSSRTRQHHTPLFMRLPGDTDTAFGKEYEGK